MNGLLREGTRYGVSVLEERQTALSDRFAGRHGGGRGGAACSSSSTTRRSCEGALAHLVARVVRSLLGRRPLAVSRPGRVRPLRRGHAAPLPQRPLRARRARPAHLLRAAARSCSTPLIASGIERAFEDGELLMERGEPGVTLYLLTEGTVRVERPGAHGADGAPASWSARSRSSTRARAGSPTSSRKGAVRASRRRAGRPARGARGAADRGVGAARRAREQVPRDATVDECRHLAVSACR